MFPTEIIVIPAIFIGLPWLILHYMTKWKTLASLTNEDENLLNDLYNMARRLDDRMDTVERLIAMDNPNWKPGRLTSAADVDAQVQIKFDKMLEERGSK